MLKLAIGYMRYYRNQTLAIFLSMVLTAGLLSGISSLLYSSQRNDLENSKAIYGSWHYAVDGTSDVQEKLEETRHGEGYEIERYGRTEIKNVIAEPYLIYFLYTDEAYREMAHRELVKGTYPQGENEIATDNYTLGNLGFSGEVGDNISLAGQEYVLSGIVDGIWSADSDRMEIFVSEAFERKTAGQEIFYLQFAEDRALYKQLEAFQKKCQIAQEDIRGNDEVTVYLKGEKPQGILDIIRFALTDEKGNFTYIVLKLQSEYNLAFNGMLALLCAFSLLVIYSIFNISVSKRTSEYGIMQALGISEKKIGGTLLLELWLLFFIGYPLGCLFGNGVLKLLYSRVKGVFEGSTLGTSEISGVEGIVTGGGTKAAVFYVAWNAVFAGFVFLFLALAVIGFRLIYAMRKHTVRQIIYAEAANRSRKIYSRKRHDMADVVVRKFLFTGKRKVIGILLSLSVGGCIFLCTTYMVENLKIHAELSLKSDDGLGSEYRISLKSSSLADTIPEKVVEEIREISGLSQVYATKYTLGELTVLERDLQWEEYFDEMNQDAYFQENYGGICVKKQDKTYGIKYDVYGYDKGMLEELREFLLEGEIKPEELIQKNCVIAVANMDGQGNYDFYGKHPGDSIVLRVPADRNGGQELLRFQETPEHYIEKEFVIAGIVSRAMAQEEGFLNAGGWGSMQSIIMTNGQMAEHFGIEAYSFINASPESEAVSEEIGRALLSRIKDVPKAVLKDYTRMIRTQKNYLRQQQIFFSGIAVILLVISLFHIMNSMNYRILARRREFGIMRAMGITDVGFYKMVLTAGVQYGLLADLFSFLFYHLVLRQIMTYYMMHVVQFLHVTSGVPNGVMAMLMVLNLLIAVIAVFVPSRRIIKGNIIQEIEK